MKVYELLFSEEENDYLKVSIVKDPAVEATLMKFSASEKPMYFANEEKKIIYSVAMRPNKKIFRKNVSEFFGEVEPAYVFYTPETVEKFQQHYFRNNHNANTNINHDETDTKGVFPFESWIVSDANCDKSKVLGLDTMNGDLVMAFKIENEEVWQQCKDGNLDGLSIEAYFAHKESNFKPKTEMNKEKTPEKLWSILKSYFAADEENPEEEKKEEEVVEMAEEEKPKEEEVVIEEDMAEDLPLPEAGADLAKLAEENATLKAKVADLEAELSSKEADKVKAETELVTMKKQTPAAVKIPLTPTKMKTQDSALEKFKRQHGIG